jgi:hypothetical protein
MLPSFGYHQQKEKLISGDHENWYLPQAPSPSCSAFTIPIMQNLSNSQRSTHRRSPAVETPSLPPQPASTNASPSQVAPGPRSSSGSGRSSSYRRQNVSIRHFMHLSRVPDSLSVADNSKCKRDLNSHLNSHKSKKASHISS